MITNEILWMMTATGAVWIRKAVIIIGRFHMPYFYTVYARNQTLESSMMMDDYGNLFVADCYALIDRRWKW